MRKIRMSGSVGASGEQSPEATRPGLLPLPLQPPCCSVAPPVVMKTKSVIASVAWSSGRIARPSDCKLALTVWSVNDRLAARSRQALAIQP